MGRGARPGQTPPPPLPLHTHARSISNARFHTFRIMRNAPTDQRSMDKRTDIVSYKVARVQIEILQLMQT